MQSDMTQPLNVGSQDKKKKRKMVTLRLQELGEAEDIDQKNPQNTWLGVFLLLNNTYKY